MVLFFYKQLLGYIQEHRDAIMRHFFFNQFNKETNKFISFFAVNTTLDNSKREVAFMWPNSTNVIQDIIAISCVSMSYCASKGLVLFLTMH